MDIAANNKKHTLQDVRRAVYQFGQAMRYHWNWQKGDVLAIFSPNSAEPLLVPLASGAPVK